MTPSAQGILIRLCVVCLLVGRASCRTISTFSSSSYAGRLRGLLSSGEPNLASHSEVHVLQGVDRPAVGFISKSDGVPTSEQQQLLDVLPSWWFSTPTTTTSARLTTQDRMDTLYKDLFNDYQRDVRPLHNCGDETGCSAPLPIQVGLKFVKFLDLDEKSSVLSVQVILSLMWPDERLDYDLARNPAFGAWDSEEDSIPVETSKLWVPDVQLANAAAPTEPIFTMAEPKAFVYNSEKRRREGFNVRVRQPAVMRVKCELDLEEFPFDNQSCTFVFRPWSLNRKWMTLLPAKGDQFEPSELSEKFEEFRVAKITDRETRFDQDELGDGAEHFTQVEYTLDLERHLHFYMARIILPMIMIVVLSAGLFYMKLSDSRVVVGVTLVLTVMSVSSFSANLLPKAGGSDTWIERFQSDCYLAVMTPLFASLFLLLLQRLFVEESHLGVDSGMRFARGLKAADACLRLLFILYVLWLTYRMFAIQAVSESREPSVYWVRRYLTVVITLMTVLALLEIFWCARGYKGEDGEEDNFRTDGKQKNMDNRKSRGVDARDPEVDGFGGAVAGEAPYVEDRSEEKSDDEVSEVSEPSMGNMMGRASLPVTKGHVNRLKNNYA